MGVGSVRCRRITFTFAISSSDELLLLFITSNCQQLITARLFNL